MLPPTSARNPAFSSFRSPAFVGLAALFLLTAGLRAWLQFGTPLAPGMNGAYYFVQARAVLEHGRLGIPDLPLTFWLHAGLARLIGALTSWPQDDAIVFAVKLADSVLPPLAALPVAWLSARWLREDVRPSLNATLAPAALVVLSAAPLTMTGDFQKNSLALVWFAGAAWTAHRFLFSPSLKRGAALALCVGLLGVTHVGVLGSALVFLGLLAGIATLTAPAPTRKRILLGALTGAVALGLGAIVTYQHDPARLRRLWRAATKPSTVLDSGREPGGPFRGRPDPRSANADGSGPTGRPDFGPDFGPPPDFGNGPGDRDGPSLRADTPDRPFAPPSMGGPPGMAGPLPQNLPRALFLLVSVAALGTAVVRRKRIPTADFALGVASALTAAVLGAGMFDGDKSQRLMLIAVVPAALALSFVLAQIPATRWRVSLAVLVIAFSALTGGLVVARGGRSIINLAQRDELRTIAAQIAAPDRTLIVAHHGLEWWTAWITRAHIAQPMAVSREDWSRYDAVYYLTESGPKRFHPRRPGTDAASFAPPTGPAGGAGFGPPGMGPEASAPENAVTVHAGPLYTLARVDTPPENQPSDADVAARRQSRH